MSNCFLCGKSGEFDYKVCSTAPEILCGDCRDKLYWIKKDPKNPDNARKIRELALKPGVSNEAANYLLGLLGESPDQLKFIAEDEKRVAKTVRSMSITSGPNFEGYRIVRYGGYVSGDEVVVLSDTWFGTSFRKDAINNAIKKVRRVAINELKIAAAEIGCNAVIGLDFDYINIDRSIGNNTISHIVLTANGTAVEIEKI